MIGAILLHFHFYSILEEKIVFYIGNALKNFILRILINYVLIPSSTIRNHVRF